MSPTFSQVGGRARREMKPARRPDRTCLARPATVGLIFVFQVYGASVGGDANELRLLSTNDTYFNLRAHGGSLDFLSTKVQ